MYTKDKIQEDTGTNCVSRYKEEDAEEKEEVGGEE
jgi:hypothetical protein